MWLVLPLPMTGTFDYARVKMQTGIEGTPNGEWPSTVTSVIPWPPSANTSKIHRKFGRRALVFEADGENFNGEPTESSTAYMMTVLRGGFPLQIVELERSTVWADGEIVWASPSSSMEWNWHPIPFMLNMLMLAMPVWLAAILFLQATSLLFGRMRREASVTQSIVDNTHSSDADCG